MSTSKKSQTESAASPPAGNAPKTPESDRSSDRAVAIEFEVFRGPWIGWVVAGGGFGGLLLWKLGTIGQWIGAVLLAMAVWNAVKLLQSLLHKPGIIEVNAERVVLPRGLCRGKPLVLTPSDVTAAYFLRHSVPWNRSAPLLVIEASGVAHTYPRDWFASEADQRRIVSALVARASG
jgi:hypothetical protein